MQSAEAIWIIGGGQFGHNAAEQLNRRQPGSSIIIVDREPISGYADNVEVVTDDGATWLLNHLTPSAPVSKIIPAVPVHLAAYWLQGALANEAHPVRLKKVPDPLINQLPNTFTMNDGSVVMSYADFICPPNCPEPDELCTYTGLPRRAPLYRYLETIDYGSYPALILQSRQFAPGVGGFYPDDLLHLLNQARKVAGSPFLTASACKCHGVISMLCPAS